MLRAARLWRFRMKGGDMFVEYKAMSRDHRRSLRVEDAVVDPSVARTVVPLSWLEQLRSPSLRLPTGYHVEEAVYVPPAYAALTEKAAPNAILAGPVVLYITGQNLPVVVNPYFVPDETWGVRRNGDEWDLRLGMDAIEQCTLFSELRPGGLLCGKLPSSQGLARHEPVRATLQRYGMKCGLAESPLVPRPWTRMRYMFIDELQRGPKMTEFVGHNPRNGTPWRFSQHTKYFRLGIWRDTIRRNDMNEGLHGHSSWQKSPQQSVPEVRLMAPYP
ncbi:putative trans-sialidase [Trypanosoma conorhini]|uniref:Putative trans-sialidase n=1 Tax=Trypanosoma conorhini TaxID=83891 RepID=A0A3S5IS17_9TRYP|nr:putative trans-sialidase [Trypanosoma conorhini]RNF09625.1 putative trans-sialidase [Trypanosoma conorhini]